MPTRLSQIDHAHIWITRATGDQNRSRICVCRVCGATLRNDNKWMACHPPARETLVLK